MNPEDPFTILGVPAQPGLDAELLQSRFDALSRIAHPDAAGENAEFAKLNAAYETLADPVKRLKALLAHFEQAPAARTGIVDEDMVERFMELSEFLTRTDQLVERYQALTSAVAKSLMAPSVEEAKRKVAVFLDGIDAELREDAVLLADLNPQFDQDGPPPPAPVFSALRTMLQRLAFLQKWESELKQRQFALENT